MSSAPTGTLLSSVKNQFERLAEQSERDLVLILFEPGPGGKPERRSADVSVFP